MTSDDPDLWSLYAWMLKSRLFEEALARFWKEGRISGEMHLGTGEEAVIAGVVAHLRKGDAMALDHRGTAALLMRGMDPVLILRECLGYPDGLCGGMGGHMHLFSKELLAASSGIVGASGPAAVGFAVATQYLRPGAISVAFFGEGAINQGMLMESMNMAATWKLPLLFVCKDDSWSITASSAQLTGGNLINRAQGLGLPAVTVDGLDVLAVWEAAGNAVENARTGGGPSFLHAHCVHLEAHFLGFQLLRATRNPLSEMPDMAVPIVQSFLRPGGASLSARISGLKVVLASTRFPDPKQDHFKDPLWLTRQKLQTEPDRLQALEIQIEQEINQFITSALRRNPA